MHQNCLKCFKYFFTSKNKIIVTKARQGEPTRPEHTPALHHTGRLGTLPLVAGPLRICYRTHGSSFLGCHHPVGGCQLPPRPRQVQYGSTPPLGLGRWIPSKIPPSPRYLGTAASGDLALQTGTPRRGLRAESTQCLRPSWRGRRRLGFTSNAHRTPRRAPSIRHGRTSPHPQGTLQSRPPHHPTISGEGCPLRPGRPPTPILYF